MGWRYQHNLEMAEEAEWRARTPRWKRIAWRVFEVVVMAAPWIVPGVLMIYFR